jgi:hypothetical protein
MHRVFRRGWDAPSENPVQILRSAGNKRHPGRLFFGYFLLVTQKKVSRLSVREPTSKSSRRASDNNLIKSPDAYRHIILVPTRRAHRYTQVPSCPLDADIQYQGWWVSIIPEAWIPAIHAGTTVIKSVYR